jgi:outer membrane protein OmpA-like peptidoglycan-associated protein
MRRTVVIMLTVAMLASLVACESMGRREKGAIIGGATGAVVGGLIGKQAGNTAVGAILGAAVGGAAGAYIGHYMDKQAEEIQRDLEGARVERVGEGIKITFPSGILFDVDKSAPRPEARSSLTDLALILNKYEDTDILIEGHTDSTGPEDYNMDLSIRRAQSVSSFMATQNVIATRFTVVGYGEGGGRAGGLKSARAKKGAAVFRLRLFLHGDISRGDSALFDEVGAVAVRLGPAGHKTAHDVCIYVARQRYQLYENPPCRAVQVVPALSVNGQFGEEGDEDEGHLGSADFGGRRGVKVRYKCSQDDCGNLKGPPRLPVEPSLERKQIPLPVHAVRIIPGESEAARTTCATPRCLFRGRQLP